MTNQEAITTINNRIQEMVSDNNIKNKMVKLKLQGKSDTDIQEWLTNMAIATLVGI